MPDLLRPDLRPLTLWLVVRRPDDTVEWVEADRMVDARGPAVDGRTVMTGGGGGAGSRRGRPDSADEWVGERRQLAEFATALHAGLHLELVVDVMFLGRPRVVVERRMPAVTVLVCVPVDGAVPWAAHRW